MEFETIVVDNVVSIPFPFPLSKSRSLHISRKFHETQNAEDRTELGLNTIERQYLEYVNLSNVPVHGAAFSCFSNGSNIKSTNNADKRYDPKRCDFEEERFRNRGFKETSARADSLVNHESKVAHLEGAQIGESKVAHLEGAQIGAVKTFSKTSAQSDSLLSTAIVSGTMLQSKLVLFPESGKEDSNESANYRSNERIGILGQSFNDEYATSSKNLSGKKKVSTGFKRWLFGGKDKHRTDTEIVGRPNSIDVDDSLETGIEEKINMNVANAISTALDKLEDKLAAENNEVKMAISLLATKLDSLLLRTSS